MINDPDNADIVFPITINYVICHPTDSTESDQVRTSSTISTTDD